MLCSVFVQLCLPFHTAYHSSSIAQVIAHRQLSAYLEHCAVIG